MKHFNVSFMCENYAEGHQINETTSHETVSQLAGAQPS